MKSSFVDTIVMVGVGLVLSSSSGELPLLSSLCTSLAVVLPFSVPGEVVSDDSLSITSLLNCTFGMIKSVSTGLFLVSANAPIFIAPLNGGSFSSLRRKFQINNNNIITSQGRICIKFLPTST